MAVLTAKTRAKIPTAKFALAGRRFPVHDKVHARVAKSYASRMVARGQLSPGSAAKVNAAANRRLAMADGGMPSIPVTSYQKLRTSTGPGLPIRPNPFDRTKMAGGGMMKCMTCGGKKMGKGGRCMACGGQMKAAGGRMGLANGSPSVNDSGRTKKRMRLKYAAGGAVAAIEFEGTKGQKRLAGNANYGGFARFDGDGGGD